MRNICSGPLVRAVRCRCRDAAQRFIAETSGSSPVRRERERRNRPGQPLRQRVRYVCGFSGGRLRELAEYLDTELVTTVLDPPPQS